MKTNFILNLKQFLFLALAFIGTFAGFSQSPQNPSIGGSKTPGTDPIGQILDIGGNQGTPRDTSGGMIVLSAKTQCIFSSSVEIGGGGGKGTGTTDTGAGQFGSNDFDPYDIGGGKSSDGGLGYLLSSSDIGGKGTTGGGRGTSTDTGQINDDSDPYDIGGRGSRDTGTGELLSFEIGGKSTPTDLGSGNYGTNPFDDSDYDIGGRGDYSTGGFAFVSDIGGKGTGPGDIGQRTDPTYTDPMDIGGNGGVIIGRPELSLEYVPGIGCLVDTGGRDSGGGLLTNQNADIGGGKSSDTGTGLRTVADTGGRNGGTGTSTSGDYGNDDDDDTGGRGSHGTTGEVPESYAYLSALN